MGKLKKPCKNAYYFFIMEEKAKHEAMGYRISGGFGHFSQTFGYKWSQLTKEEKAPYEKMAKDAKQEEKFNINNKFTVTGESYAQIHQKQLEQQTALEEMERFIHRLTSGPKVGDRMFIFAKAVHCVEEIIDRKRRVYWPSELAFSAFSLKGGIKAIYTQLVDTVEVPTGYASQAKELCEEAGLPMPGDTNVLDDDCRDYYKILKNINGFANHWLKDGYDVRGHRKVFFCLDSEREPIVSCLQWLVSNLNADRRVREKYQHFVDNLKVYKISKLILALAEEANYVNPSYSNYLVEFKLDSAADAIMAKGNLDYRDELVCGYHRLEAGMKMQNCAQSIVMRRGFMLFEEFVPAFKFDWCVRHNVEKVGKGIPGPIIKKKREKSPEKETTQVQEPDWLKSDVNNDMDVETLDYGGAAAAPPSAKSASATFSEWGTQPSESVDFSDADFPSLGASGVSKVSSSRGWADCLASSSSSRSPPRSGYSASTYSHGGGRGTRAASTSKNFMDDDDEEFPALGSSAAGRGRRY